MNEVYVVSAVRTAIGTFGGSLKDIPPAELASRVTAEAECAAPLWDMSRRPTSAMWCSVGRSSSRVTCISRARCGGGCRHSGRNTGADGQSPVRLRTAGHRVGGAKP